MKRSFLLLYVLLVHAFYGAWCSSVGGSLHCEYSNLASLHRPHSVSITEFGAVGDGVTLNTKAYQNALFYLNSFSDKGGAKLFVPAGQWLTGSFDLISHLTLWLDKGATILGSTSSDTEIRLAAGYFPDGGEELDRSKAVANGVAKSKAHYETAA